MSGASQGPAGVAMPALLLGLTLDPMVNGLKIGEASA